MTDYEMFEALTETISNLWTIFAVYVSIVFAFLVAGHLAARQLTARIVVLVISLYTLVAMWTLYGLNRTAATIAAVSAEIQRTVLESGSSLGWLPVMAASDTTIAAFPLVILGIGLAIYIGSMVFFFNEQKMD